MIRLNQWAGRFVEDGHRYYREDGKELQGVTGILQRRLFKDEYKGIPQWILDNAAERGTMIHSRIELYDTIGVGTDIPEVANYARLKEENNLECIASEYLVSDDEDYASAIDKVYHIKGAPDNEVVLGDIKSTSKFNREYVSWQLSIYADFLEAMNPHLRVVGLFGIWLREDKYRGSISKFLPVDRKPSEVVKELLRCDREDIDFNYVTTPAFITDNIDRILYLNERINALTEEKNEIIATIFEEMKKRDEKSIDSGLILFTRKDAGVKSTFDSKRFKEEHGDLYNEYIKTSETKETLQLTIRK